MASGNIEHAGSAMPIRSPGLVSAAMVSASPERPSHNSEKESEVSESVTAIRFRLPARYALKVSDDRPIQIFIAKPGENPTGWAVPVQRVLTILKPLQALEFSRRSVSTPRLSCATGLDLQLNSTSPSSAAGLFAGSVEVTFQTLQLFQRGPFAAWGYGTPGDQKAKISHVQQSLKEQYPVQYVRPFFPLSIPARVDE